MEFKANNQICSDCEAPGASWVSINKGIFLCIECSTIHRTLGRHISYVKSLQDNTCTTQQLDMINALTNNGINRLWEHDGVAEKPKPTDSIEVKTEYIRAKHLFIYGRVYTLKSEDCDEFELNKRLCSNVKTPNLFQTIELLIQGANLNYSNDEENGLTPIHIAVQFKQILQLELLLTYGADPALKDLHGKQPLDYAQDSLTIKRLLAAKYEVHHTLLNYISEHEENELSSQNFAPNPFICERLAKLYNVDFEQLIEDVFDEIYRRHFEDDIVPFLPLDSELSSVRNQTRQKLAKFSSTDFKNFIMQLLVDAKRRTIFNEEDPVYDSVASDDESSQQTTNTIETLRKQLHDSNHTITTLRGEISNLWTHINALRIENTTLKNHLFTNSTMEVSGRQRPTSMYETREGFSRQINTKKPEILFYAEAITKSIKEFCENLQETNNNIIGYGENVMLSVMDMLVICTTSHLDNEAKLMLDLLPKLLLTCSQLDASRKSDKTQNLSQKHLMTLRYYAFHLAKYTKILVTSKSSKDN